MPLDADHPLVGEGELDPLDHAVVRPRHGLEVGAQLVDRLVVLGGDGVAGGAQRAASLDPSCTRTSCVLEPPATPGTPWGTAPGARCCSSVPPRATLSTWWPRQIASVGIARAMAARQRQLEAVPPGDDAVDLLFRDWP